MRTLTRLLMAAVLLAATDSAFAAKLCEREIPQTGLFKNFQDLQRGTGDWLFREHDLINEFGPNRHGYNGLRKVRQLLEDRGITLVVVPLPTRAIVHPEKLGDITFNHRAAAKNYFNYLGRLRKVGLTVPALDELTHGDQEEPLYFERDHHWTPAGARKVASLVAETVDAKGVQLTSTRFETTTDRVDLNPGSYNRAAKELCDIDFAREAFDVYHTTYHTEADVDLFADIIIPEVVLVGTSNSKGARHYNFAGFLRQALGAEVMNAASSGGGYDTAILEYLASDAFAHHPPKVIVWEVPGYYSLSTTSFYDALVAQLEDES